MGSITAGVMTLTKLFDPVYASVAQLTSMTARAKHSFPPTDHFPDRS
jgi:hypothetical protein